MRAPGAEEGQDPDAPLARSEVGEGRGIGPVLVGAAGTEKNLRWITRNADGWITTPRDFDIDAPVRQLREMWGEAGRSGAPRVVALDFKPVPEKLEHWQQIGVTEVLFGLPDRSPGEVAAYVERLAEKLVALR